MRKFVKNSILEIFQTMYEAHVSIKKMIDKKDFENVSVLLEDCQNTAVQIGTSIESSEGEGFVTVGYLEEYCEAVYEVATSISNEYSGNKAQKVLDKKLIKAENSVKNDVKVRLEIVFCPYKASMWDSLESVWKAADEDPDCDAYVVPIPYYDRNPDYTFGEFHYEGGDYPDYVPITHYEAYNFEARRPDVVYIHNPYDEFNFVTSVDQRFYSHKLKKYTDCLVYVPYFSSYGAMGEGQYMTSVYNNADYIVLQKDYYRKFISEKIDKNIILPLGSPKFDKIINECKKPHELRADWKIAKNKTVFFFNTSIGEMLANTDKFLKKLEYVFNVFLQHTNDVCLLWRPHPLLESSFLSMRPAQHGQYIKLKDFFISQKIGVYDDTPDMNYSIAISDAYIGDGFSSVVTSFAAAGKPMFLFNALTPNEESKKVRATPCSIICSYINSKFTGKYCICINSLFYSSGEDFDYKYVMNLSDDSNAWFQSELIVINDEVYVCPRNGNRIFVLKGDKIANRINVLTDYETKGGFLFAGTAAYNEYIFLIPDELDHVIMLNTKNQKITRIYEKVSEIKNHKYMFKHNCFCIYNDRLYIMPSDENIIWSYDINSGKIEIKQIDIPYCKGFSYAGSDGDSIWLISHFGISVSRYYPESGKVDIYSDFGQTIKCEDIFSGITEDIFAFSSAYITDKYVYLTPGTADKYYKIEKTSGIISEWASQISDIKSLDSRYYIMQNKSWFIGDNKENNECYFISSDKNMLFKMNLADESIMEIPVKFDKNELEMNFSGFLYSPEGNKYACFEDVYSTLTEFICNDLKANPYSREKQLDFFKKISNNLDGTCGEKIHRAVKNNVL